MVRIVLPLLGTFAAFASTTMLTAQSNNTGNSTQLVVSLTRRTITDCNNKEGWSNLFFEQDSLNQNQFRADFAKLPGGIQIDVVRRNGVGGSATYVVRSSGQKSEKMLRFSPMSNGYCATAEITPSASGRPVRIQVSLVDKYVYGRIAEYRTGKLNTGRRAMSLQIHAGLRSAALFDRVTNLQFYLDADNDSKIRRKSAIGPTGTVEFDDRIGSTFMAGNEVYRVDSIASQGRKLFLHSVGNVRAADRHFAAPDFKGMDLSGNKYDLSDYKGRYVVIELWSTDCPFSEQARPRTLALAKQLEAAGGVYLSMARESDVSAVRAHVNGHPRGGNVLVRDERTWEVWNPETATPLFYVIHPDGTVVLREPGAGAVALVATIIGLDVNKLTPATR